MRTVERLMGLLPGEAAALIAARVDSIMDIRLRSGRPVELTWIGGEALCGEALAAERLRSIAAALMDYSFYARESELSQGFFTLHDGSRVGVCGRFAGEGEELRLTDVGSLCVRVARPMPGCADEVMPLICQEGGPRSTLLLSPPGMGKTTLLRDIARQLSQSGLRVAIADERHELAACRGGVPTLDVGPRTDVLDGCPRPVAIRQLIRAMAPQVIVADEIGGEGDADALADAGRCGVAIVASAHGDSVESALRRPPLRAVLKGGILENLVLLGKCPGRVIEVVNLKEWGDAVWKFA